MSNEIITWLIAFIPLAVSIIALLRPLLDLNKNLVTLNNTVKTLNKDNDENKTEIKKHGDILSDHEKRIWHIEHEKE